MRPYVIIYVTSSVDGKIASVSGYSKFSCEYDLRRLHSLRASVDAVLVGANTVLNDDPLLTVRYVPGKNPLRIVVDGHLKIPENAKVVTDKSSRTLIFTSNHAPADKINILLNKGVEVVVLDTQNHELPTHKILLNLSLRGVRTLLIEGGGETIWSFVKYGLFDELRMTLSPYIVGGRKATPIVGGEGFSTYSEFIKLVLKDVRICECGNEVHLIYLKR